MDNKKLFGQRLNSALALRGVKQKDLAAAIGVTDNTISYFCSGRRVPNLNQLIMIAKKLDVSTDYLVGIAGANNLTMDESLRFVSEYIGLSNEAVKELKHLSEKRAIRAYSDLLSLIIADPDFEWLLGILEGYFLENRPLKIELSMSCINVDQKAIALFAANEAIRIILDRISGRFRLHHLTTDERLEILIEQMKKREE